MTNAASDSEKVDGVTESDALTIASELLKAAFPDIKCLRCGNDNFILLDSPIYTGRLLGSEYRVGPIDFHPHPETVVLVCQRCGMMEQHAVKFLENAEKPICGNTNV